MEGEFKVRAVEFEEKSAVEIEEKLLKEHEEKLNPTSEPEEQVNIAEVPEVEVDENKIISYLGKRYNKEISSLDDIWIKNPDILSLDYNSEIIGTVYEPDMGSIWVLTKDNIIHNKKTGSYPCILHFPGSKGCNTNYETYNTVGKKMDKNGEFIPLYSTFNGKLYIYIGMFIFLSIFTIFIVFISNNK